MIQRSECRKQLSYWPHLDLQFGVGIKETAFNLFIQFNGLLLRSLALFSAEREGRGEREKH